MSSKKKLIITLSSLCAVVLVAVLTITLVLAFGAGTLTSNINVNYTAEKAVKGTIDCTYTIGAGGEGKTGAYHDQIKFEGTETATADLNKTATPKIETINLDRDNQYVVFKYSFTVDKQFDSTALGYTAALKFTPTDENSNKNIKIETSANGTSYTQASNLNSIGSVSVNGDTATDFYVKVSIDNILNDSVFSGTFSWTLTPNIA